MSIASPASTLLAGGKAVIWNSDGTGCLHGDNFFWDGFTGDYLVDPIYGPRVAWGTDVVAETVAGFQLSSRFTMRNRNPQLTVSWALESSVDTAENDMFIGFSPSHADHNYFFFGWTGSDPFNALNGISIALHGGNYKIACNDGADTTVFYDFPEPVPALVDTVYTARIAGDTDNDGWRVQIGLYEDFFHGINTQTAIVIPDTPLETAPLGGAALIINHTANARRLKVFSWNGFW